MNRKIDFFILLNFLLLSGSLFAQNTSNRGTDFWVGYMAHIDDVNSNMNLYITSDVSTTGTVSIPLQGWSTSFTVTANTTTVVSIPPGTAYVDCSDCIEGKGIHITSVLPIVLYSHIYSFERSDATLVLPVPTLGKEYYAMAYTQSSGGFFGPIPYSEFLVVAVEDSTEVQITTTQSTINGHSANIPFTINLNKGQVYQVQSVTDLTGSHIVSYSSGTSSCKRIAVFSGSSWDAVGCSGSKDNLYEQLYPVNAWGNNFITAPFKTRTGGDIFRVFAGSDNTSLAVNGGTPFILNKAQFSDMLLDSASFITASKPVTLAQFSRTEACDNVTGDPSMVILLPVEQTLDSITLFSTPKDSITGEYINVIMKTSDTSSFRLDDQHVLFYVVSANPAYSYSQNTVDSGNHVLVADSGFNAIAYGFGDLESYSYCAGANVRNLDQYISAIGGSTQNPHTLCSGTTVYFSEVVSYTPVSVKWYFGDGDTSSSLLTSHTYNMPGTYTISLVTVKGDSSCDTKDSSIYVLNITSFDAGTITALHDSICAGTLCRLTVTGSGGNIQWQSSLTPSNFTNIAGATNNDYNALVSQTTYFRIFTISGSCSGTSAVFKLTVIPSPVAKYNSAISGQTATFNSDSSVNIASYFWDFGDGTNSTLADPIHTYDTAGTYHVCLTVKNNTNCNFTVCENITVFSNGVNNLALNNKFELYPNPFDQSIFINGKELKEGISTVTIYDVFGRAIFYQRYDKQKLIEVPLLNLSAGMYYLQVKSGSASYFKSITKQD